MTSRRTFQEGLPKKRMASGCLFFDDQGRLLVVKPCHEDTWGIPGGIVEQNESPLQACVREVHEEIGLLRVMERLLCVDYTSDNGKYTESLQFIFFGGTLSPEEMAAIRLCPEELSEYSLLEPEKALALLNQRLSRRLAGCLAALSTNQTLYLEDQDVRL